MSTITTKGGTEMFYKEWDEAGRRCSPRKTVSFGDSSADPLPYGHPMMFQQAIEMPTHPRRECSNPPYEGTPSSDHSVVVAGRPVVDRLAGDLSDTGVTVVLSDEHARVVERRDSDDVARRRLDTVMLRPGFAWRVETAGTNALGIATRDRRATLVDGAEHSMAALHSLTMASAPICDPRTGQLRGAVTLVCTTDTANVLMLPLARRAARSVEHRLLDGWSTRDRVLNEAFLRARRRTRGPLALVDDRTLLMNAAAARMFSETDRSSLWETVQRAGESRDDRSATFLSGNGASLVGEIDLLREGDVVIGALIHFSARNERRRPRRTTGWDSLTEAERTLAHLIAQGLTNREAAVRLFVSHHTVDAHLRHIFRKLGIDRRVQLAGFVGAAPAPPAELTRAVQ